MGAGEPCGEMRPEWSQRGPGWTRYGPTGHPTLLRALSNDLQTILSELALSLACVRRLDKKAEKVPHFSYTSPLIELSDEDHETLLCWRRVGSPQQSSVQIGLVGRGRFLLTNGRR